MPASRARFRGPGDDTASRRRCASPGRFFLPLAAAREVRHGALRGAPKDKRARRQTGLSKKLTKYHKPLKVMKIRYNQICFARIIVEYSGEIAVNR
jgi:hypothetical protein